MTSTPPRFLQRPPCHRSCHASLLTWLLAVALLASAAWGQSMRAKVVPLAVRPRTDAPAWIEVELSSATPALRSGVLQVEMSEDGQVKYTFESAELVFANTLKQRFLLPSGASVGGQPQLRLRFVEKGNRIDLGSAPLSAGGQPAHVQVVAVGRRPFGDDRKEDPLWQSLRIERFAPKSPGLNFTTVPAYLDAADFPVDPLGYTAFDILLLDSETFSALSQRALSALGDWLAAGGSVLLTCKTAPTREKVEVLETWAARDPKKAKLTWDPKGRPAFGEAGLASFKMGLGRLVVAANPPQDRNGWDAPPWREATGFLWKMQSAQISRLADGKPWKIETQNTFYIPPEQEWPLAARLVDLLGAKAGRLPLGVAISILLVFLLAIGPGDWWALGWLRARRLTWVLFPLCVAGATFATVWLARRSMGNVTMRSGYIITDLAQDGRVVRETRFAMELPAKSGLNEQSSTHSLACSQSLTPSSSYRMSAEGDSYTVRGQFPSSYQLVQQQTQWTPIVTRMTTLGPGEDHSGVNWESIREPAIHGDLERANEIAQACGCKVAVGVLGEIWVDRSHANRSHEWKVLSFGSRDLVSQLMPSCSPKGFASNRDLCLAAPSGAASEIVLMAFRKEGTTFHMWRRVIPR